MYIICKSENLDINEALRVAIIKAQTTKSSAIANRVLKA